MSRFIRLLLFAFILSAIPFATAQEKRLVEIDDYFTQSHIAECEASPDGKYVAYVESRWELPREKRNGDIWIADAETGETRRMTFDTVYDGSLSWGPDGEFLYFTSARSRDDGEAPYNDKTQVWRIQVDSGAITPATSLEDGVAGYELSQDGERLYYAVNEKTDDEVWADLRGDYPDLEYGRGTRRTTQIWVLDLETWHSELLLDEGEFVREFTVSPDEKHIAMITAVDDLLINHEGQSRMRIYNAETKEIETLEDSLWRDTETDLHGWIEMPAWSEDGTRLAFRVVYDGYPADMYCTDVQTSDVWQIERPEGVSIYGGRMVWFDDAIVYLGEIKARTHLYGTEVSGNGEQGEAVQITQGDVVVFDFSIAQNEGGFVIKADPTSGRDLFAIQEDMAFRRITNSNPQAAEWKRPQMSLVQWEGAEGDTVEGILELPPDYDPADGPLPTIVQIHGGPTAAAPYCFRFWPYGRTLLPSKGYALLIPNYRGSTGFGDDFMTDLVGRENDIEVEDIMRGVDWLIGEGVADPDRLGVMGWSNGGFLTNALITNSQRFKAASSGAGVVDQTLQWALEDTPGHVINFMSGNLPWEDPEAYIEGSPLYKLGDVTTPTLIHVGQYDARVPAAHARTLFRGLNYYGNAPTQLIVYPGEGHSLSTYTHRKAKMEWDVAWFERYLK
jgi:dipeptidyl aminopeptidase/acylaminoacyl peptidase